MKPLGIAAVLLTALVAAGCRDFQRDSGDVDAGALAERESHLAKALAQPAESAKTAAPIARWILPESLEEVSGLALTADGRLFAHGDEVGQVSELDYRRGVLVKQFTLGRNPLLEDFEGIAIAGERMFLLASNGKLYEFREGANGDHVDYVIHDTHLGHECEFEGVAFDPDLNALLLACKNVGTKHLHGDLVVYAWSLANGDVSTKPQIVVPLKEVVGSNQWNSIHPSDITRDPATGNYVVVAAQEKALITLTPAGRVVSASPLPANLQHTEGVAITTDSLLILSDEAGKHPAVIVLYRWH